MADCSSFHDRVAIRQTAKPFVNTALVVPRRRNRWERAFQRVVSAVNKWKVKSQRHEIGGIWISPSSDRLCVKPDRSSVVVAPGLSDAHDDIVGDLFHRSRNPVAVRSDRTQARARDADVLQTLDHVEVGCGSCSDIKAVELASDLGAFLLEERGELRYLLDEVDFPHVGIDDRRQRVKTVAIAGASVLIS
jgi:hypothetical protein